VTSCDTFHVHYTLYHSLLIYDHNEIDLAEARNIARHSALASEVRLHVHRGRGFHRKHNKNIRHSRPHLHVFRRKSSKTDGKLTIRRRNSRGDS